MTKIKRTTSIEELLVAHPSSVKYLIERGLPCLVCGEPTWGTLEELAQSKDWNEQQIDILVEEMNTALNRSGETVG